jgi:hypothetical protein
MRRTTPRLAVLLLALAFIMSGTARPVGAKPAGQQGGKAKSSKIMTQSQYEELQRTRAEAAARAKAAIGKIKARAAELGLEKRKQKVPHTKVTFTFASADPQKGIAGSVTDKATGATVNFESKRDGEYFSSRISDQSGVTLVEYVEADRAPVADPLTGAQTFEPVPSIRFGGVEYQELRGPVVDEMRQLATSPQGALIRALAIYMVEYVPGHDLETERRGLEVPYQALQKFYTSPAIEEYGGGDLTAGRQFGAKRREATKDLKPARKLEPLFADAADCELLQCTFADNHDYQLSEQGGYVVKSLSPRLVLSHSFAPPEVRVADEHFDHDHAKAARAKAGSPTFIKASATSAMDFSANALRSFKPLAPVTRRDDDSQVGDCYGRCGGGCGGWYHTWVGEPTVLANYTYCQGPDPDSWMPDCSTFCCSWEKQISSYAGMAVHTASGKVTLGSKAHDSCCRSMGGPCWLLSLGPCLPALLLAADCGIPGVGDEHTWSYIGPHSEGYDYHTGNCCVAIGPVS